MEYLDGGALAIVGGGFPGGAPAEAGFLVIAESDTGAGDCEALAEALGEGAIGGVVLPPDPAALWRWRDGVGPAVTAVRGGKLSDDIAVPVERLADAVREVEAIGARHRLESCSWGHAGDGNLHATFLLDPRDDLAVHRARRAADELLAMAIEMGGTISGEHGIGVLKNGWLQRAVGARRRRRARGGQGRARPDAAMFNPGEEARLGHAPRGQAQACAARRAD